MVEEQEPDPAALVEAQRTPWARRTKRQRQLIYEDAERRRKAKVKATDAAAARRSKQRRADRTAQQQTREQVGPPGRRRWYQRAPWRWIVFVGGLGADDPVYIPGTGPGDRTATPKVGRRRGRQ